MSRRRVLVRAVASAFGIVGCATCLHACGPSATSTGGSGGAGVDGGHEVTSYPDASPLPGETECKVVIDTDIAVPDRTHVPYCTHVTYATNPPSGGDHWPLWAAYQEYAVPVPREMYVHDEEHGAVVLAYRCATSCPEVVAALRAAIAAAPADAFCLATPGGPTGRFVLTPDPLLPTPIAAAAWAATYTATCIDPASLGAFIRESYGHGPEMLCAQGGDPAGVLAGCPGFHD